MAENLFWTSFVLALATLIAMMATYTTSYKSRTGWLLLTVTTGVAYLLSLLIMFGQVR
jgi:hypothetical protein